MEGDEDGDEDSDIDDNIHNFWDKVIHIDHQIILIIEKTLYWYMYIKIMFVYF